jgi:CheY-like chemotaxis protein
MAASEPPDLILMDISMPEMDGLEVLKRLKDNTATSMIPVIFLTGKVEDENVLKGYKTGADYYITKPFTKNQLMNGIHLFLESEKATASS